ncbi:MAG TPA: DNA-binding protein [Gammaproteobacteria bacterium]|nr:DNA-binding protein [Gammaproteobacteria bacterium]
MSTQESQPANEVLSVAQFCNLYGISRALFYRLRNEGRAPRVFKVGRRVLITRAEADAWLKRISEENVA